jgi:hypothetical protein
MTPAPLLEDCARKINSVDWLVIKRATDPHVPREESNISRYTMFRCSRDVTAKELEWINGTSNRVPPLEPNVAQWIACTPFWPTRSKQDPSGVENTLRGSSESSTWAGLLANQITLLKDLQDFEMQT